MKPTLTVALALLATNAQALSCARPDPVRAFLAANEAPETYVILRGTVAEAEILVPPDRLNGPYAVPVWFIGDMLTRDGFTQPLEGPMTVEVTCAGSWCGGMPGPGEMIAFAERRGEAHVIEAGACGGWIFPSDPLTADLLTSCLRGASCVPSERND